jgi:CRISPR type I-E-associated protein CasB/Cse2
MSLSTEAASHFIQYLEWLLEESKDGRGAMANLRRGLGKPAATAYEMDRYILARLPEGATTKQEEAYYLVAALFAYWHQGKDKAEDAEGNLGRSLRRLADRYIADGASRDEAEKRLEKRLNALLNVHSDDLPQHLRQIVSQLKSKDVPLNWVWLLHDVQNWDAESRFVQHEWARGFWIVPRDKKTEETAPSIETRI